MAQSKKRRNRYEPTLNDYVADLRMDGYHQAFRIESIRRFDRPTVVGKAYVEGFAGARFDDPSLENDCLVRYAVFLSRAGRRVPLMMEMVPRGSRVVSDSVWCPSGAQWSNKEVRARRKWYGKSKGNVPYGSSKVGRWQGFQVEAGDELLLAVSAILQPRDADIDLMYRAARSAQIAELRTAARIHASIPKEGYMPFLGTYAIPSHKPDVEESRRFHDRMKERAADFRRRIRETERAAMEGSAFPAAPLVSKDPTEEEREARILHRYAQALSRTFEAESLKKLRREHERYLTDLASFTVRVALNISINIVVPVSPQRGGGGGGRRRGGRSRFGR